MNSLAKKSLHATTNVETQILGTLANPIGNYYSADHRDQMFKKLLKMISLQKWKILTPWQQFPSNVGNLDIIIVSAGFEKLHKLQ